MKWTVKTREYLSEYPEREFPPTVDAAARAFGLPRGEALTQNLLRERTCWRRLLNDERVLRLNRARPATLADAAYAAGFRTLYGHNAFRKWHKNWLDSNFRERARRLGWI